MSSKRLWIGEAPRKVTLNDYVWRRAADGPSSLHASIDPELPQLGRVKARNRDAVWLATIVFLADRTTPRRKGWQRSFEITVPVGNTAIWNRSRDDVGNALSFLSADSWQVNFAKQELPRNRHDPLEHPRGDLVCLFSGGADSMCGVIRAIVENRRPLLVSHWDWAGHSHIQSELAARLRRQFTVELPHIQVNLGRSSMQINGMAFPNEASRRSRSLLFLSLGLAVTSALPDAQLWISENGFASLNLPLAPERLGGLSTRTTHPTFFKDFQGILNSVGAQSDFTNPFADMTKGEMFAGLRDTLGRDKASDLLSRTHSCSHVRWGMQYGRRPDMHCGVCFGCIVRRAAFVASAVKDRTEYLVTGLSGSRRKEFLGSPTVRAELETVRYAAARRVGPPDVLGLALPAKHDLPKALKLLQRGFDELRAVPLP